MRMIEQAPDQRPRLPSIARFKERGGFHTAIQHIGFIRGTECDLPNVLQRHPGIRREANRSLLGVRPALAKIVARPQQRAPITLCRGPDSVLATTRVVRHRVHTLAMKIGTANFPPSALL